MKPVGIINSIALGVLLTAPAFARPGGEPQQGRGQQGQHAQPQPQQQRPHQENAAPRGPRQQDRVQQGQQPHQTGRPQERQQQERQQPHQAGRPQERQPQERQQQERQQHAGGQQERQHEQRQAPAHRPSPQEQHGRGERRAVWQEHRAHNWKSEHRNWQERGGYNGYRIPESRYRGHFGPSHAFRLHRFPVAVVGGYPRFQYGGFWFGVVDPWPEYWSDDWYDNDDVYIDYSGDGYYLYNRRYPGDRIAITVNVN